MGVTRVPGAAEIARVAQEASSMAAVAVEKIDSHIDACITSGLITQKEISEAKKEIKAVQSTASEALAVSQDNSRKIDDLSSQLADGLAQITAIKKSDEDEKAARDQAVRDMKKKAEGRAELLAELEKVAAERAKHIQRIMRFFAIAGLCATALFGAIKYAADLGSDVAQMWGTYSTIQPAGAEHATGVGHQ